MKKHRMIMFMLSIFVVLIFPLIVSAQTGCEHQYNVKLIKQATEDEDGIREFTCVLCGDTYTQAIKSIGHDWGEWQIEKESTHTKKGSKIRYCKNNSAHYEREELPLLDVSGVEVEHISDDTIVVEDISTESYYQNPNLQNSSDTIGDSQTQNEENSGSITQIKNYFQNMYNGIPYIAKNILTIVITGLVCGIAARLIIPIFLKDKDENKEDE